MASVDEMLLTSIAQSIAKDFKDTGRSLNDAVIEKSKELSFNKEQTARLIERTNTEAFLAVFPDKKEFSVADPKVVLRMFGEPEKVKEASTGISEFRGPAALKQASYNSVTKPKSYKEAMNMSTAAIFGMDDSLGKVASYDYDSTYEDTARNIYAAKIAKERAEDEMRVKQASIQNTREQAISKFYGMYKEAALRGTSTDTIEESLYLKYPTKVAAISSILGTFNTKLAKECFEARPMLKRASYNDINIKKVVGDTPLTIQFCNVIQALELGGE